MVCVFKSSAMPPHHPPVPFIVLTDFAEGKHIFYRLSKQQTEDIGVEGGADLCDITPKCRGDRAALLQSIPCRSPMLPEAFHKA